MRKPRKPPSLSDLIGQGQEWFKRLSTTEMNEFVRRANDSYVHWDKIRYKPRPEGISPEEAWTAVKLSRLSQLRDLPLSLYALEHYMRFWTPPKHQQWLHQIDQQAGGSISTISGNAIPDDNERYLFNSLMEEAIASSRLEGASSTREKAKNMLRTRRRPRDRSEQMILNNYRAILEVRDLKGEKLTPAMLCHLQEVLTADTLDDKTGAGRFRKHGDNVQVVETATEEVMHEPPHADTIPERLEQVCNFANKQSGSFVHPVIKAIVLHFAIGFIHPFIDGNGRTARAVFYWYMLKKGYWLFEYLPLSRVLISGPAQYERAYLYAEHDGGDVTYFIHFHLRIICQAIKSLHAYIDAQVRGVREASRIVAAFPSMNHRQTALIQNCLRHPGRSYTIKQHRGTYHVAYATARSDLLGLAKRGLLLREYEGHKSVFTPPDNLQARIKKTPKAHLVVRSEPSDENSADPQRGLL